MVLMKINIYSSDSLYTEDGVRAFNNAFAPYGRKFTHSFSSAPSYDESLSAIFPHLALVSASEGETITEVLSKGYNFGGSTFGPTSFASVLNDKGGRFNRNRVLWLSNASLATLQQHPDKFELSILNKDVFPVVTDNPEVDNQP